MSIIRTFFTIATAAAACYASYKLFIEKIDKEATVKTKEVKTEAKVERYEETEGSGWTVPDGAYDVHSTQVVTRYENINGYSHPVKQTKYTYKVKRWVYNRTINADAESIDAEATTKFKETANKETPDLGDERMLMPVTSYTITAASCETGEFLRIPVTKEIYGAVDEGDILTYKVRRCAPHSYSCLGVAIKTESTVKTPDGDDSVDSDE